MLSWNDVPGFQEKMDLMNRLIEQLLETDDPLMKEVVDWILVSRGKQIRPAMAMLCAAFGRWSKRVAEMAALVEISHMASLIHDDIVDNADQRRGRESVQKHFGQNIALYAGDYMVFSATGRLSFIPSAKEASLYIALADLCQGELSQFENLYNIHQTEEGYFRQINGKTATLFHLSCKIGAVESNCKAKAASALEEYGRLYGLMFQIQDDLMDFAGASNMGKPVRRDIKAGIYSLPVIFALRDQTRGGELRHLLEESAKDPEAGQYEKIYDLIEQTNGVRHALDILADYNARAQDALALLPEKPERTALSQMADGLYQAARRAVTGVAV